MTSRGHRPHRQRHRAADRRGVSALIVLACLSFATVVAAVLMQAGAAERRYAARLAASHQVEWLAEAGVDRAAAQLAHSASYHGETWPVWTDGSSERRAAVVHIKVEHDAADPKKRRVRIQADLADGPATNVSAAKEVTITLGAL